MVNKSCTDLGWRCPCPAGRPHILDQRRQAAVSAEFSFGLSKNNDPTCITCPVSGEASGKGGFFEVTVETPGNKKTFATIGLTD